MKKITLLLLSIFLSLTTQASKPIEIIVPYPPGGTVDTVARAVHQEINRHTDLNTVVVNRPGAEGVVAAQYFLSTPGDKIYITATGTSLFLKLTNKTTTFDPINDFQIIGPVATASTVLVVSEKSGINDLSDFIKQSRTRNFNCGTSNSIATFFGEYFSHHYKTKLTIVPYKGSAMVLSDLIGGHINCAFLVIFIVRLCSYYCEVLVHITCEVMVILIVTFWSYYCDVLVILLARFWSY
jgi:tripartite-type tricarboxylate transporter receptor subunit TctC